jgi:hypothetical protein
MKGALVFGFVIASAWATVAFASPITVSEGRLTARLQDADVSEVVQEVARQAQLEVRGSLAAPAVVSIQLEDVPLADALPRLLAGQSFALTYASSGRLKGVRLLGGAEDAVAPVAAPVLDLPFEDASASAILAASHRSVPIGGRLARAVGAEQTSFSQIIGVAMQNPDPRVRADALRIGLRILDAEPELRASVLETLDGIDDAWLAAWLTRIAGEHAPELARRAARSSRIGSLRLRAAAVQRHFEANAPAAGG